MTQPGRDQADTVTWRATYQGVMGTDLHLKVVASSSDAGLDAEQAIVAALTDAEQRLSPFRPDSELSRWAQRQVAQPSDALQELLRFAATWRIRTDGWFNPAVGAQMARWHTAVQDATTPSDEELAELAAAAQRTFVPTDAPWAPPPHAQFTFLAVAKGLIVDWAATAGLAVDGVSSVMVSAGGDLVHRGDGSVTVGVEDPFATGLDNAPVLARLHCSNAAVATSGSARRAFDVGGQRLSHVLDPFTGQPVQHTVQTTVVAPDAATADVLATVACTAPIDVALPLIARIAPDAAVLIVGSDGRRHANDRWADVVTASA